MLTGPKMLMPLWTTVWPGRVSSQLPPRSAAISTITDPGCSALAISAVTSIGDFCPGTAAVVITTSCSRMTSVSSSRWRR